MPIAGLVIEFGVANLRENATQLRRFGELTLDIVRYAKSRVDRLAMRGFSRKYITSFLKSVF